MLEHASLTHARAKTPKAAAIAGIAFSLLLQSTLMAPNVVQRIFLASRNGLKSIV
jgi:hypothetical protein